MTMLLFQGPHFYRTSTSIIWLIVSLWCFNLFFIPFLVLGPFIPEACEDLFFFFWKEYLLYTSCYNTWGLLNLLSSGFRCFQVPAFHSNVSHKSFTLSFGSKWWSFPRYVMSLNTVNWFPNSTIPCTHISYNSSKEVIITNFLVTLKCSSIKKVRINIYFPNYPL